MTAIKKILVPVDFSICSERALEQAIGLSERYFGASIDVLHVWEAERETLPRLDAMKEMEKLLAAATARGVTAIQRLHETGDPVRTILEVAARGYDLVIMGTHGRTGMAHDYLGSVAEKVVRKAPCPVLTFRERAIVPTPAS